MLAAVVPDFEHETHTYRVDGRDIPGVTEILKAAGIGHSAESDSGFAISDDVMEAARDRGTDVHYACELLDRNDLDFDSLDEEIAAYVVGYQNWKDATGFVPDMIEQVVYCPEHDYVGTLDRAGWIGDQRVVVDLKSGSGGLKPWHRKQLAAYAYPIKGENEPWPLRICLVLKPTTKKGWTQYTFLPQSAEWDFKVFLAARTIYTDRLLQCR